jgi:hypothetical protein
VCVKEREGGREGERRGDELIEGRHLPSFTIREREGEREREGVTS